MTQRDREVLDVHRPNSNRQATLTSRTPATGYWVRGTRGAVRACVAKVGTDTELRVRETATGPFRKLARFTDADDFSAHAFSKDGAFLYVTDARGSNTTRLLKCDVATAKETVIAEDANYDVGAPMISDVTHELVAVAFERERLEYQSFDEQFTKDPPRSQVHDASALRSADGRRQRVVALQPPPIPARPTSTTARPARRSFSIVRGRG